jgi:hypothetical protein
VSEDEHAREEEESEQVEDLDVPDEESADVKGGIIPPDLLARLADEGKG